MSTSSGSPVVHRPRPPWLACWMACGALLLPLAGRPAEPATPPAKAAPAKAKSTAAKPAQAARPGEPADSHPAPHRPITVTHKAVRYYQAAWGIDRLRVSRVASGKLLRFTFRVTDPAQAAPLVDRNATPTLFAQRANAVLSVPVMEKIGPLRQVGTPKAGQDFWVAFSNKGDLVRPGDRVNVTVGGFHADGLTVE
jgi:hypothetical protein